MIQWFRSLTLVRVPGLIPSLAKKFISITAHSIIASDLWCKWMTKTSQSVLIRVMCNCSYTHRPPLMTMDNIGMCLVVRLNWYFKKMEVPIHAVNLLLTENRVLGLWVCVFVSKIQLYGQTTNTKSSYNKNFNLIRQLVVLPK